jgi:hypothetical protein
VQRCKTGIAEFSPRKALQMVGTDLIRNHIYANLWIDIVEKQIATILSANPKAKIVVSDCRFTDEVAAIKKNPGGRLVQILRQERESGTHLSETANLSASVDITLINNNTIEALEISLGVVIDH